jgi:hypothetical protein
MDDYLEKNIDKKDKFLKRAALIEERKAKFLERIESKIPEDAKEKISQKRERIIERFEKNE